MVVVLLCMHAAVLFYLCTKTALCRDLLNWASLDTDP